MQVDSCSWVMLIVVDAIGCDTFVTVGWVASGTFCVLIGGGGGGACGASACRVE